MVLYGYKTAGALGFIMSTIPGDNAWFRAIRPKIQAILVKFRRFSSLFPGSVRVAVLILFFAVAAEVIFSVSPKAVATEVVYGGPKDAVVAESKSLFENAAASAGINIFESGEETLEEHEPVLATTPLHAEIGSLGIEDGSPFISSIKKDDGRLRYTVRPGDTLLSVSEVSKVKVQEIVKLNGLPTDEPLIVGDQLLLPASAESAPIVGRIVWKGWLPSGFIWPAKGPIGGPHGTGRYAQTAYEIPNAQDTPVVASADGTVSSAAIGWNGGYGNYVLIDHAPISIQTMYGHLHYSVVVPGESVRQGQVIGYMGSTGNSTGPHVHFEIRQ